MSYVSVHPNPNPGQSPLVVVELADGSRASFTTDANGDGLYLYDELVLHARDFSLHSYPLDTPENRSAARKYVLRQLPGIQAALAALAARQEHA
jgi:hypothetical protein